MEILLFVSVLILGYIVLKLDWSESEFDIKIKEIENILNSSDARSKKYKLFGLLHKLADECTNYDDLAKMNKLLMRTYDL